MMAKLDIRRFLRPKTDQWGSDSTLRVECEVVKTKAAKRKSYPDIPARGDLNAYVTIRDCSESVSLDFSASKRKKHAMAQFTVICNLIRDLEALRQAYADGIDELTIEGYLK